MKWNRIIGIILLLLASIGMIVSFRPVSDLSSQIKFSLPDDLSGTLELTKPNQVHVGDGAEIRLKVVFDQDSVESDLLMLFSKLEMDNLEITPQGEGKVSVDPSKPVVFNWEVTPYNAGKYTGTLWLFTASSNGERNLVLARPIDLAAKSLFGLSYQTARLICLIGLITGILVFFYPIIIKKIQS